MLHVLYVVDICLDSCFGNIRTIPAHNNYRCSGNEQTLQECGRNVVKNGCGQAAGVYCGEYAVP